MNVLPQYKNRLNVILQRLDVGFENYRKYRLFKNNDVKILKECEKELDLLEKDIIASIPKLKDQINEVSVREHELIGRINKKIDCPKLIPAISLSDLIYKILIHEKLNFNEELCIIKIDREVRKFAKPYVSIAEYIQNKFKALFLIVENLENILDGEILYNKCWNITDKTAYLEVKKKEEEERKRVAREIEARIIQEYKDGFPEMYICQ